MDLIGGNAFTKAVIWYLISWLVWIPFGVTVMDNTSYTDASKSNTYLWTGGLIAAFIFTNLKKFNILKYVPYEFKDKKDQIGYVAFFSFLGAFADYAVTYGLYYMIAIKSYKTDYPVRETFGGSVGNALSVMWISHAIVGETISPWSWGLIKDKKNVVNIALFIVLNSMAAWIVYIPLQYFYYEIIFKFMIV